MSAIVEREISKEGHAYADTGEYRVNLHYFRYEGRMAGWNIWSWVDGHEGSGYTLGNMDEDGFASLTLEVSAPRIHVIPRWSWGANDWADQEEARSVTIPEGACQVDVWLVQGDRKVYYSREEADISPKFRSVMADELDKLVAEASGYINDDEIGTVTLVDTNTKEQIAIEVVKISERSLAITLCPPLEMDPTRLYLLSSRQFSASAVTMRHILDHTRFYYGEDDLGAAYTPEGAGFKLWAPTAVQVDLVLYNDPGIYNPEGKVIDHADGLILPMYRLSCGVWKTWVSGNLAGRYYMYRLEFADGSMNLANDPYAKAVSANGQRAAVMDLNNSNPPGWQPGQKPDLLEWTDAVIYELHVRDFSVSDDSGMVHKGKFKAFTESGTRTGGGLTTGVEHLKELGITHVQLLPISDFATVNELFAEQENRGIPPYNWGYDPLHYNVPEGSYAIDPCHPISRIREFKELVQALHDQHIRVVMDVVYNHTYSTDDGPFDAIVPGYYYRTTDSGRYTNATGVGNEVASERPMVRKYICDSVRYWAEEYGIDGFRFDLMGLIDLQTIREVTHLLKGINPSIMVYGEPWDMGGSTLSHEAKTLKGTQRNQGFAVFNDDFRMAVKGDSDGSARGFATGESGRERDIVIGVQGSIHTFAASPMESINYVTAHDNFILWDKVIAAQGLSQELGMLEMRDGWLHGGGSLVTAIEQADPYMGVGVGADVLRTEMIRRTILANAIMLTSQGIPMIHAGDEFLRTKYGDHNSYKSPDVINQIRWGNKERFQIVFEYYQGLIRLRREHPAFRIGTRAGVERHLQILQAEGNVVSFQLGSHANGDSWKTIVVIYNANLDERWVSLPANPGPWNIVVNGREAGTQVVEQADGSRGGVIVPGITVMVLFDEERA